MKSYGIDFQGPLQVEPVITLPSFSSDDIRRVIYTEDTGLIYVATLTFTNPASAMKLQLKVVHDSIGFKFITWPTIAAWSYNKMLQNSANAIDMVEFYFDGSNYYGKIFNQNM